MLCCAVRQILSSAKYNLSKADLQFLQSLHDLVLPFFVAVLCCVLCEHRFLLI